MMAGAFKKYLAEATKQYDFVIKVAGELDENFEDNLEVALNKFDVANLTAGKKTPIQNVPLDFPDLTNTEVTVYETTLNYPTTQFELRAYLADVLNTQQDYIRVRKPGEPYEEYQKQSEDTTYEAKLDDPNYEYDNTEVNKDELVVTEKGKETFLQQLAKEQKERHQGEA
jgi:hypothetical protein